MLNPEIYFFRNGPNLKVSKGEKISKSFFFNADFKFIQCLDKRRRKDKVDFLKHQLQNKIGPILNKFIILWLLLA